MLRSYQTIIILVLFAVVSAGFSQSNRSKKDRGEASMLLGELEWTATSARAKQKGSTLEINASRSDGDRTKSLVMQRLTLYVPDFKGPGTYKIAHRVPHTSTFVVVGLDVEKAKDADMDQAVVETLSKAKLLHLMNLEIVIESADDKEIVGTFKCPTCSPEVKSGHFRARYRNS